MLTFELDVEKLDLELSSVLIDLLSAFADREVTCATVKGLNGIMVEIIEKGEKTLFGVTAIVEDAPVHGQGVVDHMPAVARWFLFLAAAYGVCRLQENHQSVIDVMDISLEALVALYKPTEDWQRISIEKQLRHFRRYHNQSASDLGIALTFF